MTQQENTKIDQVIAIVSDLRSEFSRFSGEMTANQTFLKDELERNKGSIAELYGMQRSIPRDMEESIHDCQKDSEKKYED